MRFVVIGGDAAGMSAASKAKRVHPSVQVTALEKTEDVSYSACGMPYNIADPDRRMDDLVVREAEVFRKKQGIDLRLGHNVEEIDRTHKRVSGITSGGESFSVEYDKLLIATGAKPRPLDISGIHLPGIKVLRSLEDGRNIKAFLSENSVKRAVIMGAGYIGLEMAEAFHQRGIKVDIIDISNELLPWLPPAMSSVVLRELQSKGADVHLGEAIVKFEAVDRAIRVVTQNHRIEADLVVVAVGIIPNSELAQRAGLELGPAGAIAVDKYLRTSDPNIFSAGDCADAFHLVTGKRVWIPLALRANRAGWAVADNLDGNVTELPGIVGTAVFKVLDLEVARTGLSMQEALTEGFDAVEAVITSRSRAYAHPGNQDIHVQLLAERTSGRLLGAGMVGKEGAAHRIDAVAVALHADMTAAQFAQCDLAYAPPFSPVWDPMLTAANQLLKKIG